MTVYPATALTPRNLCGWAAAIGVVALLDDVELSWSASPPGQALLHASDPNREALVGRLADTVADSTHPLWTALSRIGNADGKGKLARSRWRTAHSNAIAEEATWMAFFATDVAETTDSTSRPMAVRTPLFPWGTLTSKATVVSKIAGWRDADVTKTVTVGEALHSQFRQALTGWVRPAKASAGGLWDYGELDYAATAPSGNAEGARAHPGATLLALAGLAACYPCLHDPASPPDRSRATHFGNHSRTIGLRYPIWTDPADLPTIQTLLSIKYPNEPASWIPATIHAVYQTPAIDVSTPSVTKYLHGAPQMVWQRPSTPVVQQTPGSARAGDPRPKITPA